jgi:hypothetical protein
MKRLVAFLLVLAAGTVSVAAATAAMSPTQEIAQAKTEWLKEMRASAKSGDRSAKFPSPSRALLMQRLHNGEKLYGFQVVSVQMLHPLQSAPVIVIRADSKQSIARATPKIINLFDPRHHTTANPSGYAYEGYFFIAQTASGAPYLSTFNHWRAPHVGGGEWAADPSLYPFPHG